ncbi:MAG: 2Fe-2S iron-sulfur cluster binding domain-containing protein, partial [Desulfobacteraceae bacterium]|nr:2Fe-2S iron-sulfur cluster binding domain-containing protein [Desulfobacteraceae bacterium]
MLQLILSLLALSGIGAVLALLLEIADSYIADYGEKHILINQEKDLLVKGGSPLLFSLMDEGIFIPSACGGRGTCAYCKVKVSEGGGPVLPTETPYLTPDEIKEDVRLSCQIKIKSDIRIQIPEEFFLIKEFTVKVEKFEDLTPDIKGLHLKILSPEEGITFKPGQYIQLQVPKYELIKEPEYRAYSVSSGSGDHQRLELVITKVPGGAVSTYVHDYMKEGEELLINGPYGDFYLRDSENDVLLIATGSGLAPIKSILDQIEREPIQRKTTLFFGARKPKDLYYFEELKELERIIPNFTFLPTLSRPTEEDQWEGEKGRVTDLIEKYIPDISSIEVYICGAACMVESCEEILAKKGIPQEMVFYDK